MPKLSIILPTYKSENKKGDEFLDQHFKQFKSQIFTDYEIIIADSTDKEQVSKYLENKKEFNIKKIKVENPKTIFTHMNEGIKAASGEILHFICMEDFFYNRHSLQRIVDNFDTSKSWMASSYMHSRDRLGLYKRQIPKWNEAILTQNTIGSISCISTINQSEVLFDEELAYHADCDFYYRMKKKYGIPNFIDDIITIQYICDKRGIGATTKEEVDKELVYIGQKYAVKKEDA